MKKIVLVFLVNCFLYSVVFAQSPWVNKKGSIFSRLSFTTISSYKERYVDSEWVEIPFGVTDNTFGLHGAYSISDRLELTLDVSVKSVSALQNNLVSLGDPSIQIKYQIYQKIPFTVYGSYTAPISKREGILRTGYNQSAIEGGLSAGISNEKYFTYFAGGYRSRNNIPDQIILDFEVGKTFNLGNHLLLLMFRLDGTFNTSDILDPEGDKSVLYHKNGEYLCPGLKASYNIFNEWWITLGAYGAISGNDQAAFPALSIGIAYSKKN